jgi:hypothetical protein
METTEYYSDRKGIEVTEDLNAYDSDCQIISFINGGDWPFYVESANGKVKRYVDEGEEVSFGTDRPGVTERTTFNVVFDSVNTGTTKLCYIERVDYVERNVKC